MTDAIPETLEELGIDDADISNAEPARTEPELTPVAAPDSARPEAAAPVAPVEYPPLTLTLVFKATTVTIAAKRRDIATIGTYPLPGDPGEIIDWNGVVQNMKDSIDTLLGLERRGVPDIKFPEPPKPAPALKPEVKKPAAKPAAKSMPKPATAKAAPAPVEQPALATAELPAAAPEPAAESRESIQARLFNKMVALPDKRTGSVLGWSGKNPDWLEVLTDKGVELFAVREVSIATKSKK